MRHRQQSSSVACSHAIGNQSTASANATLPNRVQSVMVRLRPLIERVAQSSLSVLIIGETGVGKEVMADAIHALSARGNKPLVKLNCAALSDSLVESELFGYERGAFTGAGEAKPGLLESAPGGTVFL